MKKHVVLFILMITCFLLVSCNIIGKNKILRESVENIQNLFTNLQSYHAVVEVKVYSNRGHRDYVMEQWYKNNKGYRIDVLEPDETKGKSTVWIGNSGVDTLPQLGIQEKHTSEDSVESELLLTTFIKRYLQTEDISISVDGMRIHTQTVYEVKNPSNHPYYTFQKLWIDNKTYIPKKLIIYNEDEKQQVVVVFKKFEYNKMIKDQIFIVKPSLH